MHKIYTTKIQKLDVGGSREDSGFEKERKKERRVGE